MIPVRFLNLAENCPPKSNAAKNTTLFFRTFFRLLRTAEVRNFQETEDCSRVDWINVVLTNVRQQRIEILQAVSKK